MFVLKEGDVVGFEKVINFYNIVNLFNFFYFVNFNLVEGISDGIL